MHFSQISKPSSTFKMAHFEANFHAMAVGTSNCWSVNMKLLTRAVQTEAIENFGKKKVGKTVIFLEKTFYFKIFLLFKTHSVIHGWKACNVRIFLVFSFNILELLFEVQNFVVTARLKSSL